jgi:hypothetical protein
MNSKIEEASKYYYSVKASYAPSEAIANEIQEGLDWIFAEAEELWACRPNNVEADDPEMVAWTARAHDLLVCLVRL